MANLLKTNILHGHKTGDGNPPQQTPMIPHNIVATPPTAPSARLTRASRLLFEAHEPQRPGLMQNAQEIPPHPFPRRRNSESDENSGSASSSKISLLSKMRTPMYGNDMSSQTGMGFHHNNNVHTKAQIDAFGKELGINIPGMNVKEQRRFINANPDTKDSFRQFQIQQPLNAEEHGQHQKVMIARPREINKL